MIHLALQTEYSFKQCFGPVDHVVKTVADQGGSAAGIADLNNTFGHVDWAKACKKYGIQPIFGVRLYITTNPDQRTCACPTIFLAKNNAGLEWIYGLVAKAWDNFHYIPRLTLDDLSITDGEGVGAAIIFPRYLYPTLEKKAGTRGDAWKFGRFYGAFPVLPRAPLEIPNSVAILNNKFSFPEEKDVYQLLAGRRPQGAGFSYNFEDGTAPQYILTPDECKYYFTASAIANTHSIASECSATLSKAGMARYGIKKGKTPIEQISKLCYDRAEELGIPLEDEEYADENPYFRRFHYELNLIETKDYADYFLIVADMIQYAKKQMMVGPARGSSAGSLVCYLLGITEVDPIKHNLLFERFIDINRFDLPDIDVDFPDRKREMVVDYLKQKYGPDKVRALANINTFQPKSAINEFANGLGISKYDTEDVRNAIIERSSGDARAQMCIADTFDTTEPGQEFIAKYPSMRLVSYIEGHASHGGKHAAGIIVSPEPINRFAGTNSRDDIVMLDKGQAEYLGLLKIDCLGLRTLSILESVCEQIGMPYEAIHNIELDDADTFRIFNDMRLSGIFQFEGYALQSITRQMGVHNFYDLAIITSLARPGALNSGGAARYVKYRTGKEEPTYYNDEHKAITQETLGICIYQEQMMEIARRIGKFSWEDVSTLRKAASKSLGDEFFGKYKDAFIEGASSQLDEETALELWNDISHSGSWSFNKSHAVSYGLISYWTAYFKAHYPLEFAVASLNNSADDDHAIRLLRDLVLVDKIEYIPVDADNSDIYWSVYDGKLLGGLTNIPGVGEKKAQQIKKGNITPSLFSKLMNPSTPFDILFPTKHYFGKFFNDPKSYGLEEPPVEIKTIQGPGTYTFVGKLVDRNLRDLNEYVFLKKRGHRIEENNLYLLFTLEDDTDSVICKISQYDFEELGGKEIAEQGKVGESWYMVKGKIKGDWRKIEVEAIQDLKEWM